MVMLMGVGAAKAMIVNRMSTIIKEPNRIKYYRTLLLFRLRVLI